jgi:hypothetical protein
MKTFALILVAGSFACANANYVVNGDFSGGSLSGWTVTGSPTWYPWAGITAGTFNATDGFTPSRDAVFTGANTSVEGPTTMSQNVAGLIAGNTYTISMDLASSDNSGFDNFLEVKLGGNTLFSVTNVTPTPDQAVWQHVSQTFVAPIGGNLEITGYDNPQMLYVSDIQLNPVPEPASMAVLGLGLAAVGRRRKANK